MLLNSATFARRYLRRFCRGCASTGRADNHNRIIRRPRGQDHLLRQSNSSKMADPTFQTIHRDPALLYVPARASTMSFIRLTILSKLLDPVPNHYSHGPSFCSTVFPNSVPLTSTRSSPVSSVTTSPSSSKQPPKNSLSQPSANSAPSYAA